MEKTMLVATKGIVIHRGKALLVRRGPRESSPGIWEFPGGRLEFGEQPAEGLLREIMEETGLAARINRLLYARSFFPDAKRQCVILTYLCETDAQDVVLSDEHDDYRWACRAEMEALLAPDILRDVLADGLLDTLPIDGNA